MANGTTQPPAHPKGLKSALTKDDRENMKGELKGIGGSRSDDFNALVMGQATRSHWYGNLTADDQNRRFSATVAALAGIGPKDEVEGMLAAQMIACHNASMECFRRAMIPEQTFEGRRENLSQANKASRTYTMLVESLGRYRGKGQQKVTVEHVHVHAGGQAVVGVVTPGEKGAGGAVTTKSKGQPHAKQIADARQPALQCPDARRDAMPVGCDGKRTV